MTSTPFNVGLNGSRSSSRVLRPPGGGHTDIFGGEAPAPVRGRHYMPNPSVDNQEVIQPTNNIVTTPDENDKPDQKENYQEPEMPKEAAKVEVPKAKEETKAEPPAPAPTNEPPKRVRVPPGGFSSKLCSSLRRDSSLCHSRRGMEGGGKQSRLLSRLLGKLRGDQKYSALDSKFSGFSERTIESTGCGSTIDDDDIELPPKANMATSQTPLDEDHFANNIDQRYGGQYLTPEQLPEFCDQLHNLVEVIRNIQSYARVTGEYPSALEHRLEMEAREVAALAAEARNAQDVVARTRAQRRAVRAQKKQLTSHLTTLRETEIRELESTVRLSDRKLYKSWESLKDSRDPKVFEPLLEEIKNKQTALDCLVRLIEGRVYTLERNQPPPRPLPPPGNNDELGTGASNGRRRQENSKRANKRWRKDNAREPRSVPLSGEPSRHEAQPQPQGAECTSRYRVGSAGTMAVTSLELQSRGSVRDILFFTANNN